MKFSTLILCLVIATSCLIQLSESFGLITGTITISAGTLALIGGVAVLKAVAIKALALGAAAGAAGRGRGSHGRGRGGSSFPFGFRGKREVGNDEIDTLELEEEAAFAMLVKNEPEQCYQRLICDLATGQMPASDNDIIPTLFRGEANQNSSKFDYFLAAQLGKTTQDIKSCEVRYTCSLQLKSLL